MYTSCTLQLLVQLNFIFKMIRFSLSHFKISCPGHSHDLEGPPEGGEDEDPVSTLSRPKGSAIRINTLPFHSCLHILRSGHKKYRPREPFLFQHLNQSIVGRPRLSQDYDDGPLPDPTTALRILQSPILHDTDGVPLLIGGKGRYHSIVWYH